ncbi:MAG: T9SS type A sorting domain-containing protein [Crocinitomicaceae bacterium]|nr:T9SS type A sorting domain-containing protein [Crocinitomicaceae bacterium]
MKKILLSILCLGGVASLSFGQLFDHTANISTSGVISAYMVDNDTLVQCADDFTIPVGGTWDVTSVTVHGFRNNAGADMDSVLVQIYADATGQPAATPMYSATHQLAGSVPSPQGDTAITVTIPTQTLTEGTYWVSVAGYSESASRWNWTTSTTASGANGMLIDADDYFGAGATAWTDITSLGITDPDFGFSIDGTGYMASIPEDQLIELSVYPNPVIDYVQINVGSDIVRQVSIFNVNGQRITTIVNPGENKIDVSDFESGVYLIEVTTDNGVGQTRFVKG